jgi:hypothetical protein
LPCMAQLSQHVQSTPLSPSVTVLSASIQAAFPWPGFPLCQRSDHYLRIEVQALPQVNLETEHKYCLTFSSMPSSSSRAHLQQSYATVIPREPPGGQHQPYFLPQVTVSRTFPLPQRIWTAASSEPVPLPPRELSDKPCSVDDVPATYKVLYWSLGRSGSGLSSAHS